MHNEIPNIPLNNEHTIPQLGLGVFRVDDATQVKEAVKWALAAGYRHIDTASYYANEKEVGEAIAESDVPREDVFVTSKFWNDVRGYDNVRAQYEKTLDLMGFDYLDMYLIHWPADGYVEAWAALVDLYHEGKIKNIGVSNFEKRHIEDLLAHSDVKPVVDQIETHPYFQQKELHAYLKDQGIIHEAWSPLGGGKSSELNDPLVKQLAENHGVTPAQIILRWHVEREEVVIPKSIHQNRIQENRDIFAFGLDEEEMKAMAGLDRGDRVGSDPNDEAFLKRSVTYNTSQAK
ncbi:aldo/keto reductase [Levilactobacillus bambusae]|uniref:Aldo/keto reductase n=1 Tax=Levilactobacillus bambusae TaxID=2024736 RepID=A0A2V1MXT3_9LACO|nr:aldo/keto reductase [Levilactobacillus bambusae]PWF99808.1 aldo/keto reductase [Levilactobacillus bambusae]